MRLIYECSVSLVSRPSRHVTGITKFLEEHGLSWKSDTDWDGQEIPELAGRLCYMSFDRPRPGGNKAYLERIKQSGHGSVLEHSNWGFIVTGVSRSLTHELVRHRAGFAYSQLSQRYVDESVAEYVVPPELTTEVKKASPLWETIQEESRPYYRYVSHPDPETQAGLNWLAQTEYATSQYIDLVEYLLKRMRQDAYQQALRHTAKEELFRDVPPETPYPRPLSFDQWQTTLSAEQKTTMRKAARGAARSLLPNATETKIFVTANARAWRHFIEMRGSKYADVEIRRLAYKIWDCLKSEAIHLFSDYVWTMDRDGFPLDVETPTRKV